MDQAAANAPEKEAIEILITEAPVGGVEFDSAVEQIDAGSDIDLIVRVTSSPARELVGTLLEIRDHDGAVVADAVELDEFDGEVNKSVPFTVRAPAEPGEYTWSVLLPRREEEVDDGDDASTTVPFTFTASSHATRIEVWDVPAAIPTGEAFDLKVGIKCSVGCDPTGREFDIYDHEGTKLTSGAVGKEPAPGTTALHFSEVTLAAPASEGTFRWEVRAEAWDGGSPHAGRSQTFGVTIVPTPEHVVTVKAVDQDKGTPIEGLTVILHPFRAQTDADGVAKLSVASGEYRLNVSGLRYFPFRTELEIAEDTVVDAELEWEVRPEKIS